MPAREEPPGGGGAAAAPGLPEETRRAIGRRTQHVYEVTVKDIRRYAQAIGDPNPLYSDLEYARATLYGGIISPPLFCHALAFEDVPADRLPPDGRPAELDVPLPCERAVGGSSSFDCLDVVRPGDTITVTKVIDDIYAKRGRTSDLFFVVLTSTYVNQHGVTVARERATFVHR